MHDYVPSNIGYMILQNGVYISIEGYYDYVGLCTLKDRVHDPTEWGIHLH
jgi:hypothetical protein